MIIENIAPQSRNIVHQKTQALIPVLIIGFIDGLRRGDRALFEGLL
jgi:hypothetical protein